MKNSIYITLLFITTTVSCQKNVPVFNGENAFNHLIKQCEFGPRNPGSNGHKKALAYFLEILNPLADTLFTQSYIETMPRTGKKADMNNVIAPYLKRTECSLDQ